MTLRTMIISAGAGACAMFATASAHAGAHTWRITEAFSDATGAVQFIELQESAGGMAEVFLANQTVTTNSHTFTFPSNYTPTQPTSNRHILLATDAFAALPCAPARDFTIPANFFNPAGDTLVYHVTYDIWTISAGQYTPGCVNSLHKTFGGVVTIGPNDPANYAGDTHQVNACLCPADISPACGDRTVNVNDLLAVITHWGPCPPAPPCIGDIAPAGGNGVVNVDDLLSVITHWGPCP